jgi:cell division initiation protein
MSLSPLDISRHEFSRSMRGFDPNEVHAFLERLADEIADLQAQVNSLAEQNRAYASKLGAYQEMEKNLRDTLVASQDNAKVTREQVEVERQQILREAELDADQIKLQAQREIMSLHEDLRGLKLHHDSYVKRLRFLLKAQTELLDLLEQESPELPHERSEKPAE